MKQILAAAMLFESDSSKKVLSEYKSVSMRLFVRQTAQT